MVIDLRRKMKKILAVCCLLGCVVLTGTGVVLLSDFDLQASAKEKGIAEEQGKVDSEEVLHQQDNMLQKKVQVKLASMTLEDKIAQMLIVSPEALVGGSGITVSDETMKQALANTPVGGMIYFKANLISKEQTKKMIADAQSYSETGLFIATDEEGGRVNRLMNTVGTTYVGPMYNYRNQGTARAKENAKIIATDMAALGFNLDFAPDADVWSNRENTVIGNRAYSDDFGQAAELIPAAVEGFHEGGVLCTLKHFPGHGDTLEDTHKMSAYVNKTRAQLEQEEFLPFQTGIAAGADFVMVGHLIVEDIDTVPATLSPVMISGILRQDMGFEGIIITDSLKMNAMKDYYTAEEIAVLAVQAGNDILLDVEDVPLTIQAITGAVARGEISEERIDESVKRILCVKYEQGIWK